VDDNKAQALTQEQILELKASAASGEVCFGHYAILRSSWTMALKQCFYPLRGVAFQEIIQKLVESSASFASKTEFSQAKYLKRKQQKYDRRPHVWLLVESNLNNMWMLTV